MTTVVTYKGYTGTVDIDFEAGILFGRVTDLTDVITFQGTTVSEARQAFHDSIDDYLDYCKELGREPERPFSGRLLFRTTPEHHRNISVAATLDGKSINAWMDAVLSEAATGTIERHAQTTQHEDRVPAHWRLIYNDRYYGYEAIKQLLEATAAGQGLLYGWAHLAEHLSRTHPEGVNVQRDYEFLTNYFRGTGFNYDWQALVQYLRAHSDELRALPLG